MVSYDYVCLISRVVIYLFNYSSPPPHQLTVLIVYGVNLMSRSIHLEIIRAVGLKDVQKTSKCAARVEINYNKKEILKTKEVKKTLDPVFGESVTFQIKEEENDQIKIHFTVKTGGKEMGNGVFMFTKYIKTPNPYQLPLIYKGDPHGELHINVHQRTPAAYKIRLTSFLATHLPEKLSYIETYLEKHKDEDEFFTYLTKKYGAEPPASEYSYSERLSRFLEYHLPSKQKNLESFLKGSPNESEMFTYLITKYGPEPTDEDLEMQREVAEEGDDDKKSISESPDRSESVPQQLEDSSPSGEKSVSERVHEIYAEISPEKIKTIPSIIQSYEGREEDLLKSLEKRLADHRAKNSVPASESSSPSAVQQQPVDEEVTLQRQLSELTSKLKEFRHENKSLKDMVETSNAHTKTLEAEITSLKSKQGRSGGGDDDLIAALEDREQELCEENSKLQEEITKLRQTAKGDDSSSSSSNNSKASDGSSKKKKKSQIISDLRRTLADLQEELNGKDTELVELKEAADKGNTDLHKTLADLQEELNGKSTELNELKEAADMGNTDLHKTLADLQEELNGKSTEIAALKESASEKNDDSGLRTELEILREQNVDLQSQTEALSDELSKLKEVHTSGDDVSELLISELQQTNKTLEAEVDQLNKRISSSEVELRSKIELLEGEKAANIKSHDTSELEIEVETLRGELTILQSENANFQRKIEKETAADTETSVVISEMKSENEKLTRECEELKLSNCNLKQEVDHQISELETFTSREKEIQRREELLRHKESATGQSYLSDDLALREAKIKEAEKRIEATQVQINQQTKRLHEEVRKKSEEADSRLTDIACKEEELRISQLESQKALLQSSPRKRVSINTPTSPSRDREVFLLRKEGEKLKQKCLQLEIDNNVLNKEKESSIFSNRKQDYERAEAAVAEKLRTVAKREQELTEREKLISESADNSTEVQHLRQQLSTIESIQSREVEVINKTEAADSLLTQVKEKETELLTSRNELTARWTELNEAEVHFSERRRDEDAMVCSIETYCYCLF